MTSESGPYSNDVFMHDGREEEIQATVPATALATETSAGRPNPWRPVKYRRLWSQTTRHKSSIRRRSRIELSSDRRFVSTASCPLWPYVVSTRVVRRATHHDLTSLLLDISISISSPQ